ncbi:MAG: Gfo/Idh/MocA family oxidoreductase [Verrucomicrobiota bacterium]
MSTVKIGIIGGGLMGREMASAFARWCALQEQGDTPVLTAVADLSEGAREWFKRIPTVKLLTSDYHALLESDEVDVVYVAVPHQVHEKIYLDVLRAEKDLFAEKPFGIDLSAAENIAKVAAESDGFVRCSSEFPFFPGAQRAFEYVRDGHCGRILDAVSGFHHSSDLDPNKSANWKRQSSTCGEIGVLGDLGMHVCHVPFRLDWKPHSVFAQLTRGYETRPDGKGGEAVCDTWDNALLNTWVENLDGSAFPLRLEMKRLSPGETNTWFFEVTGTEGGVRFSSKHPKQLHLFERGKEQSWKTIDLGFQVPFPTITGGIFEVGFPDVIQQMWASYLTERAGSLDGRFHCVTPEEAVTSQRLFAAALKSQESNSVAHV